MMSLWPDDIYGLGEGNTLFGAEQWDWKNSGTYHLFQWRNVCVIISILKVPLGTFAGLFWIRKMVQWVKA